MQGVTKITARLSNPLFSKCPFFHLESQYRCSESTSVPGPRSSAPALRNVSPYCVCVNVSVLSAEGHNYLPADQQSSQRVFKGYQRNSNNGRQKKTTHARHRDVLVLR